MGDQSGMFSKREVKDIRYQPELLNCIFIPILLWAEKCLHCSAEPPAAKMGFCLGPRRFAAGHLAGALYLKR